MKQKNTVVVPKLVAVDLLHALAWYRHSPFKRFWGKLFWGWNKYKFSSWDTTEAFVGNYARVLMEQGIDPTGEGRMAFVKSLNRKRRKRFERWQQELAQRKREQGL